MELPLVPDRPNSVRSPDFVERATAILDGMRACLHQLDELSERGCGVAAAHLSHAIESLQQALEGGKPH